jgi:radical SAM protein with 4Fe4S-binding SPASM domain
VKGDDRSAAIERRAAIRRSQVAASPTASRLTAFLFSELRVSRTRQCCGPSTRRPLPAVPERPRQKLIKIFYYHGFLTSDAPNWIVYDRHFRGISMAMISGAPRCHIPWQQMVIDSTGYVAPCCYWSAVDNKNDAIGNINEQSLDEIWNGEGYQKLRAGMANGDLEAAGCANCYAVKQGMGLAFEYDADCEAEQAAWNGVEDKPSGLTPYAENIRILKQEIAAGATVLQAKPTIVSFTPSHRCNIRCTHCYQESTRTIEISRQRADQEVVALAPYLVRLVAGGGEPFLLPIWNKFLNNFDLLQNPYLDFSTSTNATIVSDKIAEGLGRFKKLTINVSLDGTGEAYERVRVGANFVKVRDNIRRLKVIVASARNTQSAVGVSMCVMKSNILDLPNFVRFCTDENLAFGLAPVATMPLDESLRSFNDPQRDRRGWAAAIDEAEHLVQTDYLPTMVQRRGESAVQDIERDFWRQNFRLLREAAEWDTGRDGTLYRVRVRLVAGWLDGWLDGRLPALQGRSDIIVHVFPIGQAPGTPAPYWAPLDGEEFEISLPKGCYGINLSTKWTLAEYWDVLRFDVDGPADDMLRVYVRDVGKPKPLAARNKIIQRFIRPFQPRPVQCDVSLPALFLEYLPEMAAAKCRSRAYVFVLNAPDEPPLGSAPISLGKFSIKLPPGDYGVNVSDSGFPPIYWDRVNFTVEPGGPSRIQAAYGDREKTGVLYVMRDLLRLLYRRLPYYKRLVPLVHRCLRLARHQFLR